MVNQTHKDTHNLILASFEVDSFRNNANWINIVKMQNSALSIASIEFGES